MHNLLFSLRDDLRKGLLESIVSIVDALGSLETDSDSEREACMSEATTLLKSYIDTASSLGLNQFTLDSHTLICVSNCGEDSSSEEQSLLEVEVLFAQIDLIYFEYGLNHFDYDGSAIQLKIKVKEGSSYKCIIVNPAEIHCISMGE